MKRYLADAKTILVLNGQPYRLVREFLIMTNNPCKMCDLRKLCLSGNGDLNLAPLCRGTDRSDAWFFKENKDCVNHHILQYVQPNANVEILDL